MNTVGQEYRPDIDGLRAIAVLYVVLYHTELGWLPGGFIGVDIFFVLSGYLITNQLVQSISTGRFRFREFYVRRIRRLVPAFTAMSLASLVVGYYLLRPQDFLYHAKLAGLGFISLGNFYIENTTDGYFAPESSEIPLLHIWSLSVEEQFYLVWPAFLVLFFRFRSSVTKVLLLAVIVVLMLSVSQWQAVNNSTAAYYLLPARFIELMIGSVLVFSGAHLPQPKVATANVVALLALFALFATGFLFSDETTFPGVNALVVCVATALLVHVGRTENLASRALSLQGMVWVGQLSYSLYLWHWPVLAFWRYREGALTNEQLFYAVLLSFLLAIISLKFIEQPFRYSWRRESGQTFGWLYVFPFSILLIVFLLLDATEGWPSRFGQKRDLIAAIESRPDSYEEQCPDVQESLCKRVLLVGDSHAEHLGPFVEMLRRDQSEFALVSRTDGACPPLLGVVPVTKKANGQVETLSNCEERNTEVFNNLAGIDFVFLAAYWALPELKLGTYFLTTEHEKNRSVEASNNVLENALRITIEKIVSEGIRPVLVKDNLTIQRQTQKCSYKRALLNDTDPCLVPEARLKDQRKTVDAIFSALKGEFPSLIVLDPSAVLCNEGSCEVLIDGTPLYRDRDHLNAIGAKLLGYRYRATFGTLLETDRNNDISMSVPRV